jgi:hypothetical protein
MLTWSQSISGSAYPIFNLETMELVYNTEASTEPKEILRQNIIKKKYLMSTIEQYEKKLKDESYQDKEAHEGILRFAKKTLKDVNEFIYGRIKEFFQQAMDSAKNLKNASIQKKYLAKEVVSHQRQLKELQSKVHKETINEQLRADRLKLKKASWDVSGYETEYEAACNEIDKNIPFEILRMLIEEQAAFFFSIIRKPKERMEDGKLSGIAMYATISSYVLQIKMHKFQNKIPFCDESHVPPLWQELQDIRLLLKMAKIAMLFESSEDAELNESITLIEAELKAIEVANLTRIKYSLRGEDKERIIKFKIRKFEQLTAMLDGKVMQGVLPLLGKQKTANEDFLEVYIRRTRPFFDKKNPTIFYQSSNFESMEKCYESAIDLLMKKKELMSRDEEYIGEVGESAIPRFVREHKPYFYIKSEISNTDIYVTRDEILFFIKEMASQHRRVNHGLFQQKGSTLAMALSFVDEKPLTVSKDETKDDFVSYGNRERIGTIEKTGFIINYGEWRLWLRNDLYVMILGGHNDSRWYGSAQHKHTYDSMKPGILKNPSGFAKDIRILLESGGEYVSTTKDDYDRARFAVAKFISEPARNWEIWLINLMLLDLIEDKIISWEEFFDIHPMRGGSYTKTEDEIEVKKTEQINNDIATIAMNWLKIYWPYAEYIEMADSCGSYHEPANSAQVHHVEKYYRNTVIMTLLLKRMNSLKRWDYVFSAEEYYESLSPILEPHRIGMEVLFSKEIFTAAAYSNDTDSIITFVKEWWKIKDKIEIVELFERNLSENLKLLREEGDDKLLEFYSSKRNELLEVLDEMCAKSKVFFESIRKLREVIPLKLALLEMLFCGTESPNPNRNDCIKAFFEAKEDLASYLREMIPMTQSADQANRLLMAQEELYILVKKQLPNESTFTEFPQQLTYNFGNRDDDELSFSESDSSEREEMAEATEAVRIDRSRSPSPVNAD